MFLSMEHCIMQVVKQLERNGGGSVYPRAVSARIMTDFGFYRAEQTLRRDMSRLADAGKLYRVGGKNARRGYVQARVRSWQPMMAA